METLKSEYESKPKEMVYRPAIQLDLFPLETTYLPMNPYEEIYRDLLKKPNQEKVIEYLSSLDFHFMNYSTLRQYKRGLEGLKSYQFMIQKRIKGDDFKMIVAIKILGEHLDQYYIRLPLDGRMRLLKVECEWKVGKILNLKKKKVLTKFPDSLDIQQRIDWRKIADKVYRDRVVTKKDYDWFAKYLPELSALNPHLEHFKKRPVGKFEKM